MNVYNTLVIEDSKMSQKVYKNMLDQRNDVKHEITFATSAEMALSLYNANRYDIILVDMVLEGEKTGLDFLKVIKSDPNRMYSKVVIISGQTKEGMSKLFFDAGADDVYFKPIDVKGFETRIRTQEKDINTIKELMGDVSEMKQKLSFIEENTNYIRLGETTRDIMHEINNSLSIITLCVEKMKLDESIQDKHGASLHLIAKALGNIDSISSSVKHQSSTSEKCEQINLKDIINQVIDFSKVYSKKYGVKINNEIPKDIFVDTNLGMLEQVLINLIKNACEAVSSLDSKWIKIHAEVIGGQVFLRVIDSGKLEEDIKNKLFKMQFTTKTAGSGTGVGLSIVKNMLDKHDIKIHAGNYRENTCFTLKFPK